MNIAVIFAGGSGKRMNNTACPKQFLELKNKPIIIYTLEHFDNHPEIDAIVIACIKEWIPHLEKLIKQYGLSKVRSIVPGGQTGQESIYRGLCAAEACAEGNDDAIALIHDGVRPLINSQLISDNIAKVRECGSSITCAQAIETFMVKREDGELYIPKRESSMMARAPQCFYLKDIIGSHRKAIEEGRDDFIDCCMMMDHYGYKLGQVEGPIENIKITTPMDFYVFRAIIELREHQQLLGV